MKRTAYDQTPENRFSFSFSHGCLLILLACLPLSCSAQKNILPLISSSKRSDGKGHVIRFHLRKQLDSFDFSQPQPHVFQLELHGSNLDSTHISLDDQSEIIKKINYHTIPGGLGLDVYLSTQKLYRVAVYPDRAGDDLLAGLTLSSQNELAKHIKKMTSFGWSKVRAVHNLAASADTTAVNTPAVDPNYQKIRDKIKFDTVVLDAGHGGRDTGAIGYHHTLEKDVVLSIAKKVGGYIKKYLPDVKVVYTRKGDHLVGAKKNPNVTIMQSLIDRGQIANRANGDLFVCIHANSASARRAHGTETYFLGLERSKTALDVMKRENNIVGPNDGDGTKKLSQEDLIVYELANSGYIASSERLAGMVQSQFKNRANRKSRGVKQARFVVLYHASMPAILIETGFLTNPSEAKYLTSNYGQSIIASAIFRAIRNYKVQFEKSQHLNEKQ